MRQWRQRVPGRVAEAAAIVGAAIVTTVALQAFVVKPFQVNSPSMAPTIHCGDRIFFDRISYHFTSPGRFDVVLFRPPQDMTIDDTRVHFGKLFFVKRVMGLPGEQVAVHGGRVEINGRQIRDRWFTSASEDRDYGPERIPKGAYFVMGDNRAESLDSRLIGAIRRSQIIGRALVTYWPVGRTGGLAGSRNDALHGGKDDRSRCKEPPITTLPKIP